MKEILSDAGMGGEKFVILRKTWTQESGVPQMVDIEEIHAWGIFHPADPARLDLLPEESRHDPIWLIHSTEPLSLGEQGGDVWTAPDEIHRGSEVYRVFQIRPCQAFGFWKAWAVRV